MRKYRGPLVRKQPRKRNKDGTWRKKRNDAGKKRSMRNKNDVCEHCGSAILPPSNTDKLTGSQQNAIDQLSDRIVIYITEQIKDFDREHLYEVHLSWYFHLDSFDAEQLFGDKHE